MQTKSVVHLGWNVHLREMSVCRDNIIWFAVFVDDFGATLQPDPMVVLCHEAVGDQTRTARLDHCMQMNCPSAAYVYTMSTF